MKQISFIATLLVFSLISINSFADVKKDKIEALVKAQGLLEIWQQMLDSGKIEGEKQARQILDQIMAGLNPSPEFKNRFDKAVDKFIANMRPPLSAQDLVDLWAQCYGSKFTEEELDEMLRYYSSAIGQKERVNSKVALVEFTNSIREASQPVTQKAVAQYVEDLKIIASECNCKKKK